MEFDILYRPVHTMARVRLEAGEAIVAESGAMMGMSHNVDIATTTGGLRKGIGRMLFGGETLFRNTFTARGAPGEVWLAQTLPGDMVVLDTAEHPWFIQSTSYVASEPGVDIETKVGGFKSFFAGEGLFVLRTTGRGRVLVGAFGALERIDVDGSFIVDTGHLVAWADSSSLRYRITKAASGWIASFLSGEGFVCQFEGKGTVWMQTRHPAEFGRAIARFMPPREQAAAGGKFGRLADVAGNILGG